MTDHDRELLTSFTRWLLEHPMGFAAVVARELKVAQLLEDFERRGEPRAPARPAWWSEG